MKRSFTPFHALAVSSSVVIAAFIVTPLLEMISQPSLQSLLETAQDKDVLRSVWLSVFCSGAAALIALVLGTPLAYLLARGSFRGKKFVESIIDLPIMIPHPVVGIAILSLAGKGHLIGEIAGALGIRIMGSITGIVVVLTYVGLPFYVNTVKAGFEAVPARMEHVSRSLGASPGQTFMRVTGPLAWRTMIVGMIMCAARAVSEFGAVIVVAYHPMVAPVLMYERFTAYGLKYSQPVAVWLIVVCLVLFLLLRVMSKPSEQ
jgi:molybdate/tungstate transport system permease protein